MSKTTQVLQLFKCGKSLIDVVIKLDLSLQEVQPLYQDYLNLNRLHFLVETFKEFDKDLLWDCIEHYLFMKEEGIGKKEIVEVIKKSNDYQN